MEGQGNRPPIQQGLPPSAYGGPNQYLGQQRPAGGYPQRPVGQPGAPGAWGSIPGFYPGTSQPVQQQAPEGGLLDLVNSNQRPSSAQPQGPSQHQRPPGVVSAQPQGGRPSYSATPQGQAGGGYHANPNIIPARPAAPASVYPRGHTPVGQPISQGFPGGMARPTGGQVYGQPMQNYQMQANRFPSHLQPRPNVVHSPGPNGQQPPRPGVPPGQGNAAVIAQQYNAIVSGLTPGYGAGQPHQYVPQPMSDEDRRVLPRRSLKRKAVAAAGDPDAEMEATLEAALIQVADDFLTGAVTFACGLSQRRKSRKVEAPDISVYFEQTWRLRVPGFSGTHVKEYRRPTIKALHQERTATVRKEISAASEAAAVAAEKQKAEAEVAKAAEGRSLLPPD